MDDPFSLMSILVMIRIGKKTWRSSDQFDDGKPYHRIERVDLDSEGSPLFDDGEHILYVNGSYEGDSDIGRLIRICRLRRRRGCLSSRLTLMLKE